MFYILFLFRAILVKPADFKLLFSNFIIIVWNVFFSVKGMNKNKNPSKNDEMDKINDSVNQSISAQYNEDEQINILKNERNCLKKKLEKKEETLRKLKMVKLYRNKVCI